MSETYQEKMQRVIMTAIVKESLTEVAGERVAHIRVPEILDALTPLIASMVATSPEAATPDGVKKILRRLARKLDRQVHEFNAHVREHGAPFAVSA